MTEKELKFLKERAYYTYNRFALAIEIGSDQEIEFWKETSETDVKRYVNATLDFIKQERE